MCYIIISESSKMHTKKSMNEIIFFGETDCLQTVFVCVCFSKCVKMKQMWSNYNTKY